MSLNDPTKVEINEDKSYDPPAIIYEDVISTRAGSPILGGDSLEPPSEDIAIDLFPSD